MEEHINQIGLKREDAINRVRWRNDVYGLSRSMRGIRPPALTQTQLDLNLDLVAPKKVLLQHLVRRKLKRTLEHKSPKQTDKQILELFLESWLIQKV